MSLFSLNTLCVCVGRQEGEEAGFTNVLIGNRSISLWLPLLDGLLRETRSRSIRRDTSEEIENRVTEKRLEMKRNETVDDFTLREIFKCIG